MTGEVVFNMKKVLPNLKHALLRLYAPTLFFFVGFHIIAFTRALMAEQYTVSAASSAAATIGALIVGKAIMIAETLPLLNWFRHNRLVYNVMWRIFLYVILVLLIQFIEELIPLVSKYGSLSTASERLLEEIDWHRFWSTHILLILFLLIYTLATTIAGAIGRNKLLDIFFAARE